MSLVHTVSRFFAFTLLTITLTGCSPAAVPLALNMTPSAPPENPTPAETAADKTIRILALGDSYTIGESVPDKDRWPVQLAERLRAEGLRAEDPIIIARTGWTTDELAAAVAEANLTGPFDLVTLLIGVNNQYRGRSAEEYQAQFRDLIYQAVIFAGDRPERVIVLSIPDWGVTPFARGRNSTEIAAHIDEFNRINRLETEDAGAVYIDITPISREAGQDLTLLAEDGIHPSGKMYAAWVEAALPVVIQNVAP